MITVSRFGSVAVVTFENPPVNALSIGRGVVSRLAECLTRELANKSVAAVVITSTGNIFSAGADIADFDRHGDTLTLMRALTTDVIERACKPVIAAIQGAALGGGLELALACHYRIAAPDARFGLPEVTLGLLPGGGGTQRLPRLVGAQAALDMMLTGKPVDAATALSLGLVDAVAHGDLVGEALALAASLAGKVRRTLDLPAQPLTAKQLGAARARAARSRLSLAPQSIVEAVVVACHDQLADTGMALEARLFEELRLSPASLGLRHAFFARRQVSRAPGLPKRDYALPRVVGVVGAGTMGSGIALALLGAGMRVILHEARLDALAAAEARISRAIDTDVAKGRISASEAQARRSRLQLSVEIAGLSECDIVIEAVFEDIGVKQEVFSALDALCKPEAILASNTSTLDLDVIAGFTRRPDRVIGTHFFSPANVMRLLEVVRGAATSQDTLGRTMAFAKQIGKTGVVAGVCDGFIGNRMFEEYLRQAWFLLEEGALPGQIDAALERWGMAMGPCRTMDMAGQDIGWSIRKRRAIAQPDRPYSRVPDLICELGRFGQKTSAGFYLYPDGPTATPDPTIDGMIADYSRDAGIVRRAISDDEIVDRCVLALVNEGARIVEEGIAFRPLDVDVVYIDGYGFPAEKGGPMFYADHIGLAGIVERMKVFAAGAQGWAWQPAALLVELAAAGRDFGSRNG